MSQKQIVTTDRAGLKVKSTIKAGKIALNHNTRPRTAKLAGAEPSEPRSGLRVQTAVRSGFGVGRGPGPAPGG